MRAPDTSLATGMSHEWKRVRVNREFTVEDFLLRFLAALALVLLTYNPTRYSFVRWLAAAIGAGRRAPFTRWRGRAVDRLDDLPAHDLGLAGCARTGVWPALFSPRSIWVLVDLDVLALESMSAVIWVALVCLAVLLAVGMSWGHWKRRASGQVEVDEVER